MLVVDLCCDHGHRFEGWFGSGDDLASQQARGLLSCPVCGSEQVQRLPSAAHINRGVSRQSSIPRGSASGADHEPSAAAEKGALVAEAPAVPALMDEETARAHAALVQMQKLWLEAARHVVENTEDVGSEFAQEARKIHHGDAPERGIRGQATREEREALAEEGIDVFSMPLPDGSKNRLQ